MRVRLTDFGLARAADDASLTHSGIVAGTPLFMAPEQALAQALDHRADLFSLGSVMYAMTAGRPPFRAETPIAVMKRVIDDAPRPIRESIPETPEWLCAVIAKLHAKDPAARFGSAREVAELLDRCAAARRRTVGGAARGDRRRPPARPRRRVAAVAAAVVPVAAGVGAVAAWRAPAAARATSPTAGDPPAAAAVPPLTDRILPVHGWVSLLPALDATADHVGGIGVWTRHDAEVEAFSATAGGNAVRLRLPVAVESSDYKLAVALTRTEGDLSVWINMPAGERRLSYTPWFRGLTWFSALDG